MQYALPYGFESTVVRDQLVVACAYRCEKGYRAYTSNVTFNCVVVGTWDLCLHLVVVGSVRVNEPASSWGRFDETVAPRRATVSVAPEELKARLGARRVAPPQAELPRYHT